MFYLFAQFSPNKPYYIVWAQQHIKLSIFVNISAHINCNYKGKKKNTIINIFVYYCALTHQCLEINTFRVHAPFFKQQKKTRFLRIFFVFPTGEKNEKDAPVWIEHPRVQIPQQSRWRVYKSFY